MRKSLKRFITVLKLGRAEKKLLRQVFFLLLQLRLHMVFSSFQNVLNWVKKKSPVVSETKVSDPRRLAWMVESTGLAFPRLIKCLPRAFAGFILNRHYGWDVKLKIGTRRRRPGLPIEAHAWLEWEGEIIIGEIAGMEKYAVFDSLQGEYI